MIPLRITLEGPPGAITGTLTLGESEFPITSWQRGGDDLHINARVGVSTQVTISLDRQPDGLWGGLTLGETQYVLHRVRISGRTITGEADEFYDAFWATWDERVEAAR